MTLFLLLYMWHRNFSNRQFLDHILVYSVYSGIIGSFPISSNNAPKTQQFGTWCWCWIRFDLWIWLQLFVLLRHTNSRHMSKIRWCSNRAKKPQQLHCDVSRNSKIFSANIKESNISKNFMDIYKTKRVLAMWWHFSFFFYPWKLAIKTCQIILNMH